jgi:thiamine biosynthesis lipoprotein ApbE
MLTMGDAMNAWTCLPLTLLLALTCSLGCRRADPLESAGGRLPGRSWSVELAAVPEGRSAAGDLAQLPDSLAAWWNLLAPEGEGGEIAGVNALAGSRSGSMSRRTYDLLMRCFRHKKDTEGAVDFLAGPLHRLWGLRDGAGPDAAPAGRPWPGEAEIDSALALVTEGGTFVVDLGVLLSVKGMEIDLEPLVEGVLADRLHALLRSWSYLDYRLQVGGVQRSAGHAPGRTAWSLALLDGGGGGEAGRVEPGERALATLDAGQRSRSLGGRTHSGVIDPRSGRPVPARPAVWVLAPDGEKAQVWARSLWLDGEEALPRLAAQNGVAAAWLDESGQMRTAGDFPAITAAR